MIYVLGAIYYLVLIAVLGVGLFLVVGSLMNYPALVKGDEDLNIIYRLLGKLCPFCIKIYHIIVGVVFSALAIVGMFHPHAVF